MTYEKAKQCFDENNTLIGDPDRDRLIWNLSAGLFALANAIQLDFHDLRNQLQDVAQQVRNLERR